MAGVLDRYKRGRAWIEANRSEMEAQGWTARTLFRAGRYAYPYGEWGLAWAGPWDHPGLSKVHLPRRQVVEFVIAEGGREVAQRIEGQ